MTDPALIFRAEALRSRQAQPVPERTRRPAPRWIGWAYWTLLALVAAGLAAGALIRAGDVARGPAVIRGGALEAVVPAVYAADLHPGLKLQVTLGGRAPVTVTLTATGPQVADAAAADALLRIKVGQPGPAPGALLVLRAAAPKRAEQGATGTVSVQVSERPLIVTLVTGLASGARDG
jgi:hypothetical protein